MGPKPERRTLAVDIGGSGVKCLILDPAGDAITARLRRETPEQPTPEPMLDQMLSMAEELTEPTEIDFERISVGFPGVVIDGEIRTAVNLHDAWVGFNLAAALEERTGKPARVANDADVQGLGVIEGRGVELVLTLGTGIGSALFVDGRLVPNLELGHHPFQKGQTYEERLGAAALLDKGSEKWNERLMDAIALLDYIFNFRMLYLGGGNAKKIRIDLPANVRRVANIAGLLGGIALWKQ
jgi:polyphosphate glucokinase